MGNWIAELNDCVANDGQELYRVVDTKTGEVIVDSVFKKEALVISAAPDFLSSSKELLEEHDLYCSSGPKCGCPRSNVMAAIDKAEGTGDTDG